LLREETVQDIMVVEKDCQRIEQGGLTLAEAKALLAALQQQIVGRQTMAFLATHTHCQACGTPLRMKGHHTLTFQTLFGILTLPSPRLRSCPCAPYATTTFSPLVDLLPERGALELQWSHQGAHLLLQTRVKTLNGGLRAVFKH
jgi:hypothetical protein